ncbi:MAG TPA: Maf family protein [Phycisphaerae bacterium]|nr:Maf family protein [Phycisphaerae bacterium]
MATGRPSDPPLILASASPRRRQLLGEAGYSFIVAEPPVDEPEHIGPDVPPTHKAEALSYFKARSVAGQFDTGLIIAADTLVVCGAEVFGKPTDLEDARRILGALLGRRQEIITGVTLLDAGTERRMISHDVTVVVMGDPPVEQVEAYLAGGAWRGKAGAYGIQDEGDAFVERVEGSFTNVVGLPMELLSSMLLDWGYGPAQSLKRL